MVQKLKKGKLRGVTSEGMFCSVAEFGISSDLVRPEEAQGIYIFPEGTPIGLDIKEALMLDDTVYEFELTANRADCFSMVGLSREFGIMTNQKALFPVIMVNENGESIEGKASVAIEAHDLCTRLHPVLLRMLPLNRLHCGCKIVCVTAAFALLTM